MLVGRYTLRPRSINNANAARVVYLPLGNLEVKLLAVYRIMSDPAAWDEASVYN